jgi:hypothetical protein
MGAGYSAKGIVAVTQRDDHSVAVRVLDVSVSDQTSTLPERVRPGDWIGHVHNMRCEDNQSGGHWQVWLVVFGCFTCMFVLIVFCKKVSPTGGADESNELWAGGSLSALSLSFSDSS